MHKVFFIEILSQTLKLYLIYLFLSKIGIIIGSFLLYFLLISYRYLIKKIFHLQYVSFDKSLMGFSSRDQYTINLLSLFDRTDSSPSTFEPSVFKKTIITRVISQIPKMRSKIVYKLLNFYILVMSYIISLFAVHHIVYPSEKNKHRCHCKY